ncbi:hypothetical protein [Streptococcus suis]|nr:hypothetical protein [Streptococcus suis]
MTAIITTTIILPILHHTMVEVVGLAAVVAVAETHLVGKKGKFL